MNSFRFGPQVCGSLVAGGQREWLVADGCGGYACGTVSGLRTRRYHGLLVVASPSPASRRLALAALDPVLRLEGGSVVRLGTHEWASGAVDPHGHELLASFELRDGLPTWRWRVGGVVLERTMAMRRGIASLAVVHTLVAGGPVTLTVEPLCTWRDAHGERYAAAQLRVEPCADGVLIEDAYRMAGPNFTSAAQWYHGVYHREEAQRGLNPIEDLLRVGEFAATLTAGETLEINAWAGDSAALATAQPAAAQIVREARQRANAVLATADVADDAAVAALTLAADSFVVTTPAGPDVVAGYPWFGTWSRDTMISYPGLFLATGRGDEGRRLLTSFASRLSDGMIANTADTGRLEYNTADATLWFVYAVERHVAATGDTELINEIGAELAEVVAAHLRGTRYGIRADPADGLLDQGAHGVALTWMDAIVDGVPVTPRRGKTVELNALWINALNALARLGSAGSARTPGPVSGAGALDPNHLNRLAEQATGAFHRSFATPAGWLRDYVDTSVADHAAGGDDTGGGEFRPNQLLAVSLPYGPARGSDPAVIDAIATRLLTPLGLRTLAPGDPQYRGRHEGDPAGRDRAYHQGTVWPWLIGPYADAAGAVGLATDGLLDGLIVHLGEWGIGSVSETANGDPPHEATGCPFQAWSVAEVLRIARSPTRRSRT